MDEVVAEAERMGLRWGRPDGALVSRAAVVAEARSWLGTPFVHQHDAKGVGVDCGGLIRGVSVALGLIPANYREMVPARLRGYARQPEGDLGMKLCDHYWRRIPFEQVQPGDVVLVRWGQSPPQHGAIVGSHPKSGLSLIHALGPMAPNKVVEHSIRWLGSGGPNGPRFVAAYALPGVA